MEVQHGIEHNKTDAQPRYSTPFRGGWKIRALEKQENDWIFSMDVIDPALTKWTSQIIFLPKREIFASVFTTGNLTHLRFAIPLTVCGDEYTDSPGHATTFPTFVAITSYYQVEMTEKERNKTVFPPPFGFLLFRHIQFGLDARPGESQSPMSVLRITVKFHMPSVCLDDVEMFYERQTSICWTRTDVLKWRQFDA